MTNHTFKHRRLRYSYPHKKNKAITDSLTFATRLTTYQKSPIQEYFFLLRYNKAFIFFLYKTKEKNICVSFADNRKKQTFTIVPLLHVKQKRKIIQQKTTKSRIIIISIYNGFFIIWNR